MILHKLNNPRTTDRQSINYTMAMDSVEFIAIQCAVRFALDTIRTSGEPFTDNGIDLSIIYGALDIELHHPTER